MRLNIFKLNIKIALNDLSRPPCAEDIWTDEYIKKRGWQGDYIFCVPIEADLDELWYGHTDDADYFRALRDNVDELKKYYNTQYIENAICAWCVENCSGRWDRFLKYGIEFEDEADAVLFKFVWCLT